MTAYCLFHVDQTLIFYHCYEVFTFNVLLSSVFVGIAEKKINDNPMLVSTKMSHFNCHTTTHLRL